MKNLLLFRRSPFTKFGHTLFVPKTEIDYIFDLDDETLKNMMVLQKSSNRHQKAIPCQSELAVIGLEVPHLPYASHSINF
ncbi:MAG: hypothetical protein IPQ19_09365 [Bacteroidetes bacterium]|nr:hypothetical protein [Bacteroidota bacterium]